MFAPACRQGYLVCTFGDKKALMDFVHVDNLVEALLLAAAALDGAARAGGKARAAGGRARGVGWRMAHTRRGGLREVKAAC